MSDFDVFENRWEISGKINLVTPLRIGGGQNAGAYSLSQTPVLLSYDAETDAAEPYIPGSSLKGVLRSAVERIVRTFNEDRSCIAVGDKKTKVLCGDDECISCSIFGSMKSGAMIRVLDAHLSDNVGVVNMFDDRPHYAAKYIRNRNVYKIKNNPKGFRSEEVVAANISFDLNIKLDNAEMVDVGFLLLGLDEFNAKRCFIGGGSSRGQGFVEMVDIKVIEKSLNGMNIKEVIHDIREIKTTIKNYIDEEINTEKNIVRRDFDVYYNAYSEDLDKGHIVTKFTIETLTDFKMAGIDEVTVTNMGVPVIPGSTIKGWLRHTMIQQKIPISYSDIDDIFGSISKEGHSSRLIVSDAFPDSDFSGKDSIPTGTILTMWMVFDNMEKEHVGMIYKILNKPSVITGNTSSEKTKRIDAIYNKVEFIPSDVSVFKGKTYLS